MAEIPSGWDSRPPPKMGARRAVLYREDHKSFGEFLLSDQVRDPVEQIAGKIAGTAKGLTPRSEVDEDGVHMADQYTVVRNGGVIKVDRAFRVMVLVENLSGHAAVVEFGGRNNARRRPLGRAALRFGDMKTKGQIT